MRPRTRRRRCSSRWFRATSSTRSTRRPRCTPSSATTTACTRTSRTTPIGSPRGSVRTKCPGGAMPQPQSLADLLTLLDLDFKDPERRQRRGRQPRLRDPRPLVGADRAQGLVASRRPRSCSRRSPADGSQPRDYVFLAFDPGETVRRGRVARSDADRPSTSTSCCSTRTARPTAAADRATCSRTKLTTGWSNLRDYESTTALNNTIADCRQCHAPDDSQTADPAHAGDQAAVHALVLDRRPTAARRCYEDFHAAHGSRRGLRPHPRAR